MRLKILLASVVVLYSVAGIAQKREFDYNELMKGRYPANFINPIPAVVRWLNDEQVVMSSRTTGSYVLNVKTGSQSSIAAAGGTEGVAAERSVFIKDNDIYYTYNGSARQITSNKDEEKNPTFSPDSNYIAYTRNNNLFTYNLHSNKETQITTDGSTTTLNGYASWVYWEEIFGRATTFRAFWWSPDSKKLAYMRFDESMVPMFPIYISEGQQGRIEETRYPKAGNSNPEVKVGLVSPNGGQTVWAQFNQKDDQYFGWPLWNPATNALWVQWMNRDQNNLKIYEIDAASGSKKEVYDERQNTWINLEDEAGGRVTFLKNKSFILISDRSGYNHLYLHNADGSLKNAITSGKFTVQEVKFIDEKGNTLYFTARGLQNSARTDLYSIKLNGSGLKRLTFGDYHHSQVSVSPGGKYFITTYSNVATPPRVALLDTRGKMIRELASAAGNNIGAYTTAKTELIRIKSSDGLYDLPAVVTWPVNMDSSKKYPLLISIYGGPNAGTVWDSWNWTPQRQVYANEGLIQVALDHRASGHFGKEGMNHIYKNLGYWEMEDYKTMVRWLINNGNADAAKVCISGFSYGGYLSAYALTYGADVFTHGMAGGSVVDWSLYDTHYTERFMGTPQNNAEGYRKSSVLSYINRYKGMLQIVHGTSDDNVHLQNSLQLVSALQDRKKHFELMLYPGGRHGWRNLAAKNDHYDNLKTKFVYQYLLEKEVPAALLK